MAYIKTEYSNTYPEYLLKKRFKNKEIYISTSTTLESQGWNLFLIHALYLNGKPEGHLENQDHEVNKTPIGLGSSLGSLKLLLSSTATRLPADEAPNVRYKFRLETATELIDEFELENSINPAHFYTSLKFRLEP